MSIGTGTFIMDFVVKSGDSDDAGAPAEEKGGRSSHAHTSE
jgi:hypothetical protein